LRDHNDTFFPVFQLLCANQDTIEIKIKEKKNEQAHAGVGSSTLVHRQKYNQTKNYFHNFFYRQFYFQFIIILEAKFGEISETKQKHDV